MCLLSLQNSLRTVPRLWVTLVPQRRGLPFNREHRCAVCVAPSVLGGPQERWLLLDIGHNDLILIFG